MRLSNSATLGQIRSDSALGAELGFQDASFTLPPNRSSATEHRRIFIVSDDSDTRENETDEERAQRLHRNEVCADMRRNDTAIHQAEHDMENANRRNLTDPAAQPRRRLRPRLQRPRRLRHPSANHTVVF